ncbi:hypothetical protein [Deinococcus cellulosilyticus]|uniref:DUF4926 domain-containing protein n=1 Tax=Deinococcus cellulosilyticus (strain DSM 18568 / NBRC 106333 / KACC 11606 / 5516J-15) TaxID=1223518 RepID=A0A511N3P5_DEIC1|nr:hypothetical protein [Deinococcus cellulosilyticus]GEM47107.1 hypothetical protein DC3_27420 [Deinococcus cellulosilyticus NBRC 106333 = KACC 11606]
MDLKTVFDWFAEKGERHTLDLKTGEHFEGYILEVFEEHLLFGMGGPLAPAEPVKILLDQIDPESLWYWDINQKQYLPLKL